MKSNSNASDGSISKELRGRNNEDTSDGFISKRRDRERNNTDIGICVAALYGIASMPLAILWFPFLLVVCIFAAVFILGVFALLLILVPLLAPIVFLLMIRPKIHLSGYNELGRVYHKPKPQNYEATMTDVNRNIPMLTELRGLLTLSDFVYMYIDFRKLIKLGKMPVGFDYIMLESDEMSPPDIINGVPHRKVAFGPDGEGEAGIRPLAIFITVLRFLCAEAARQRVQNVSSLLGRDASARRPISKASRGTLLGGTILRDTMFGGRRASVSLTGGDRKTLLNIALTDGNEKSIFQGLAMFEECFLSSVTDTSYPCTKHALGGTLCSESGLHGVQCLIDSLVRGAENGCKASKELIDILNSEDVDEFDSDVAKISQLFYSVAKAGCIFKQDSIFYTSIMDMDDNDQRIVWTNDQSVENECVYIIVASKKKRRVTVIFRGTTTLNDIIKNVDFDILPKPNPIDYDYPGKTDSINLNCGYGEFLFTKRDDTGKTKFDEIADRANEYGKELGEGGYSLYVTGHSMGGALACTFGLYTSADGRFAQNGNPVRVYTFAAPLSGRISFAKAFQYQENAGLLQHLRVSCDTDVVTLVHYQSDFTFAHTGIALSLHDERKIPSVKYVQDVNWWHTWTANIQTNIWLNFPWTNLYSIGTCHVTSTFAKRIEHMKDGMVEWGLDKMTLDDMYDFYVH